MKIMAMAVAAVSLATGLAQAQSAPQNTSSEVKRIMCGMSDPNARPWLMFEITVTGKEAPMKYAAFPFKGAEIPVFWQTKPGLQQTDNLSITRELIYIEWAGDGDAGYARLKPNGKSCKGILYFPEGGPVPEYGDDAKLKVTCEIE